jgi:hypothetical protein
MLRYGELQLDLLANLWLADIIHGNKWPTRPPPPCISITLPNAQDPETDSVVKNETYCKTYSIYE